MHQVDSISGARMVVSGRPLLNFGGSSYLGLGAQAEIIEAGVAALRQLGAVNQLPRHYGFESRANAKAEAAARAYFGLEGAMFFATGYLFGLITMAALAPQCERIFIDANAHYNLVEGALATGRPIHRFAHREAGDLAASMRQHLRPGERPLVATDGMFPTYGTVPDLASYHELVLAHDGWLVVDESHAFGAVGGAGRGSVEHAGLARDRIVAGGSVGKAFGAQGGLAVGTREAIDAMWKTPAARGAALGSSAAAAMTAAALGHLREHPERFERLRANALHLKQGLRALGLAIADNPGPVATFELGDAECMKTLQAALYDEESIFVIYSTYVGAGPQGCLRCAAFVDHEREEIDRLVAAIERLLPAALKRA